MGFIVSVVAIVLIYASCAAVSNDTCGRLKLAPVFHGMFVGIGAYSWGIVTKQAFPLLFSLIMVVAISATLGALALALSETTIGTDFALLSFGLQTLWHGLASNSTSVTRGPLGIAGIPSLLAEFHVWGTLILAGVLICACQALSLLLARTSCSVVLQIVGRSSELAWTLGRNPLLLRMLVGAAYGVILGVAGAAIAGHLSFISPDLFAIGCSVGIMASAAIGERWGISGTIIGSFLVFGVPEFARVFGLESGRAGYFQLLLGGMFIVGSPLARTATRTKRAIL